MIFIFTLLAIAIGILMPLQAGLNAELTRQIGHPFLAGFLSLLIGAILLFLLIPFNDGFTSLRKLSQVSPHLFLGGVLGAIFVTSSLFFIPKLGATGMISAFITGQLLGSILIDHFGLLGVPVSPINFTKILGTLLLFSGVFLIMKKGV